MENKLANIGDLLNRAWQIYKARFWVFLGLMVLPFLLSESSLFAVPKPISAVFSIAGIIVGIWFAVALLFVIKDREQKIGFQESLAKGWHKLISYWWVSALTLLVTMGGLFLFIVPGVIFSVWFGFSAFVLISEDLKGMNALFRSKQLVKGFWKSVFWRQFVVGALAVAIVLGIEASSSFFQNQTLKLFGSLATILVAPIVTIYNFLIYEDLKRLKQGIVFEPPKRGTKAKYIIVAILGLLLIPAILAIFALR